MQIQNVFKVGMAILLSLTLAACASSDTEEMSDEDMAPSTTTSNTAPVTTNSAPSDGLTDAQRMERDTAVAMTVFYFELDRSDLSAEARAALVHHANRLKATPSLRYRLEGHADERGTREYNLALGERRAQAIERYLQVQGVPSNQLETISFGEENPVDRGANEAAYSRNRRVEIH